jgi:hypothetical protein
VKLHDESAEGCRLAIEKIKRIDFDGKKLHAYRFVKPEESKPPVPVREGSIMAAHVAGTARRKREENSNPASPARRSKNIGDLF